MPLVAQSTPQNRKTIILPNEFHFPPMNTRLKLKTELQEPMSFISSVFLQCHNTDEHQEC